MKDSERVKAGVTRSSEGFYATLTIDGEEYVSVVRKNTAVDAKAAAMLWKAGVDETGKIGYTMEDSE